MKVNTTRRNVFAGLALAAILGTTGCSAINPQATTFEYAPSDGTQTTVTADDSANADAVDFLNIGVITADANESGRLMGTIHNKSGKRQKVELEINNQTFDFSLSANESLMLEDEDVVLESVGTEPGLLAEGVATAFGNSNDFNVPVLPPTLDEYRELYPGDLDEQKHVEHLYDFQGQFHRDEQ